ncbi:MAG: hypothetical protein KDD21_10535 [Bacteroidetes bacterium]|nr:hypothetical protein [Bacteroidota bacterium]
MRKSTFILSLFISIVCALIISSCKKDKTPECRILSVITNSTFSNDTTYFSYDSQGRVIAAVSNSGSNITYSYFGNSANRITTSSGFSYRDSLVFENGNLLKEVYSYSNTGVLDGKVSYSYNASWDLIQYTDQSFSPASLSIQNLNYSNGNPISVTEGGTTIGTIDYYTDKSSAKGDYLDFFQFSNFGYGRYLKSKNLIKSQTLTSSGITYNYTYEFDSNGNVSKLTINDGTNTSSYIITYACD